MAYLIKELTRRTTSINPLLITARPLPLGSQNVLHICENIAKSASFSFVLMGNFHRPIRLA
jgi:hypothetical protein